MGRMLMPLELGGLVFAVFGPDARYDASPHEAEVRRLLAERRRGESRLRVPARRDPLDWTITVAGMY